MSPWKNLFVKLWPAAFGPSKSIFMLSYTIYIAKIALKWLKISTKAALKY